METSEFEVVWPLGQRSQARPAAGAPEQRRRGPLDLNSAKVAFVWNYTRKGDQMFQIMQRMLKGEYPDISFVDYDTFGNIHGASEGEVVAALPNLLKTHKADVVVVGIGA
jgi:hypothetical protein